MSDEFQQKQVVMATPDHVHSAYLLGRLVGWDGQLEVSLRNACMTVQFLARAGAEFVADCRRRRDAATPHVTTHRRGLGYIWCPVDEAAIER